MSTPFRSSNPAPLKILVIDDEAPARRKILRLLRSEPEVEVVAEADNAATAITSIEHHQPHLVFLDVQMPGADGFDVVRAISANKAAPNSKSSSTPAVPRFVFVTAHDHYAVRAFEVHAFDYLLKPVADVRFREVLRRALDHHAQLQVAPNGGSSEKHLRTLIDQILRDRGFSERLLIREDTRAYFVNVREISWIESDRNYLTVHTAVKSHTMRATLDAVESTLDPKLFARINRGAIVRLDAIRELQPWFHGEFKVILRDKTELRWSRRYVSRRPELLNSI
jgi:two-component system LytT family response regulator